MDTIENQNSNLHKDEEVIEQNQNTQSIQDQGNNAEQEEIKQNDISIDDLESYSKEDIIKKYIFLQKENDILRKKVSSNKQNNNQPTEVKSNEGQTKKIKKDQKALKKKEKVFEIYQSQHYALKMSYVGINYQGLAYQIETENTVEEQLFKALEKTTLIQNRDTCNFTRSGRTDKGVSALGQVIGITLRTSIKINQDPEKEENKLDYIKMLNSNLPDDIRILSCTKADPSFNARFDCVKRIYKYFFFENSMSIDSMREATKLFIGEHDFRNFCKIDVLQTTNYVRIIHQLDIEEVPCQNSTQDPRSKLYVAVIVGSAFLWHQIRNIMAILFLVGKKQELPSIVSELLDIESNPQKPNYEMAADYPLILFDCLYDKVKFNYGEEQIRMYDHFLNILQKRSIENQLYLTPLIYLAQSAQQQNNYDLVENSIQAELKNTQFKKYVKLSKRQCALSSEQSMKNLKGKKLDKFLTKQEKQQNYEQMREQEKQSDENNKEVADNQN